MQGNVATFVSSGNLDAQWYSNNVQIVGATNANLVLTNAQMSYEASYSVVYSSTNTCGFSPVTNSAYLFVTPLDCTNITNGLQAWWRAEGNATDTISTNDGTVSGTITYTNGQIGQGFYFNGHGNWLTINTNLGNFGTGDFTVQFWICTTNSTEEEAIIGKRSTCDAVTSLLDIRLKSNGQINLGVSGNNSSGVVSLASIASVKNGVFHHYAAVRSGTTLTIYIDGAYDTSTTVTTIANINNNVNLRIGKTPCIPSNTDYFVGTLDEIMLYNRALSSSEISAIYGKAGGVCVP